MEQLHTQTLDLFAIEAPRLSHTHVHELKCLVKLLLLYSVAARWLPA